MNKLIFLLLFSLSGFAQNIITRDTTGNVFVLFVRGDSIAVVYQGRNSSFTTDGIYAYDFAAFNLKLKESVF